MFPLVGNLEGGSRAPALNDGRGLMSELDDALRRRVAGSKTENLPWVFSEWSFKEILSIFS